jgi:hypothetical protein
MPSKSRAQQKYVYHLRGKYKTRKDTPEKYKWVWDKGFETIEERTLRLIPIYKSTQIGDLILERGDRVFLELKRRLTGDSAYSSMGVQNPWDEEPLGYDDLETVIEMLNEEIEYTSVAVLNGFFTDFTDEEKGDILKAFPETDYVLDLSEEENKLSIHRIKQ